MKVLGTCKGDAAAYVVASSEEEPAAFAASCQTSEGLPVPATVHPISLETQRHQVVGEASANNAWVVAVPLLKIDETVSIRDAAGTVASVPVAQDASQPQGRLHRFARRRSGGGTAPFEQVVRGIEYRDWTGRTRATVTEIWPAGDVLVWRVQLVFATSDEAPKPRLQLLDARGRQIEASPILMEDHVVPAGFDLALHERFVTFSVRLSPELEHVVLVGSLEGVANSEGFACMTPDATRRLRSDCEGRLADAAGDPGYEHWLDVHRATERDLAQQRETARAMGDAAPTFGVVIVDTEGDCKAAQSSVTAQCYERYEMAVARVSATGEGLCRALCEAVASVLGNYLVFLDSHDTLEPDALWRLAEVVSGEAPADLIYADEDHVRDGHYVAPDFKTFPNLGKLRAYDYTGDLLCVSRALLQEVGLPPEDAFPAWHYDLALRAFEKAEHPAHVAHVLCHVRDHMLPGAHEAGRHALERHMERCGVAATVEDGPAQLTYRVRYALPNPAPLVSIVIPSKDHADLLHTCVTSILERSTYPNYEIVVVENNSTERATFDLYEELQARDQRVRVITWKPTGKTEDGFNYSAIVNAGACAARGELVVFLNNDTQVIEPAWLEEMAGCLTRPEVAVVGAKLLFEDGLVQHAGMIANPNCDNAHINQNLWRNTGGYDFTAVLPSDMNMVTGACQMVRRSTLEELGGYDENLAVGYNDSEFCLRVSKGGYSVAFTPYALLYHREFSSRGREVYDAKMRQRLLTEKAYVMAKYPAYYAQGDDTVNPNLDRFSLYFKLRW